MPRKNPHKNPVFLDFFAGCGGLSLGLEEAGFTPLFVNELNKDAMATYLVNRKHTYPYLERFNTHDIKELVACRGKRLQDLIDGLKEHHGINSAKGDIDLVVGGPPCQGFSGIGHRRSYSVNKEQLPSNHLYEDFAYVISKIRPKIFMFENVKGLLSSRWTPEGERGEIWHDVRDALGTIKGYRTAYSLVRAADYGVPQNRPRVLLVGIREDMDVEIGSSGDAIIDGFLPESSGTQAPHLVHLLGDLVDPRFKNCGATTTYPRDVMHKVQEWFRRMPSKRLMGKGEPLSEHEYSVHAPHVVEKFKHMLANGGEIPEKLKTKKFAQRVLPKKWGETGPSITATSLPDDYVHFSQPRILTVREWARLQCFPDWYEFKGKRTTGGIRRAGNPRAGIFDREVPKYTQIGNAVPVWLGCAVGQHFRKLLNC